MVVGVFCLSVISVCHCLNVLSFGMISQKVLKLGSPNFVHRVWLTYLVQEVRVQCGRAKKSLVGVSMECSACPVGEDGDVAVV